MIPQVVDTLSKNANWLLLAHEKPDGDTTGCVVAMARLGLRLGKHVLIACSDPFPDRYSFLWGDLADRLVRDIPDDFPERDSVIVSLDTSNTARAVHNLPKALSRFVVVNIDHHADNERYGSTVWVDAETSATAEMVTKLMLQSGWGIEKQEAEALYVALVTDNGNFAYASTTTASHRCAIALLDAGVRPEEIAEHLESRLPSHTLHLWGRALITTELFADGRAAMFRLTAQDFEETTTSKQDTENLVNFLLRIQGVRLAAFCNETEQGVKVSLRARAPYSARQIAAAFGGGGHELASGCTVQASLSQACELVRKEMERHVATRSADSE